MGIIICVEVCRDCGKNFQKDPLCLGDYSEDGVLLRYCPVCGQMFPYLSEVYRERKALSNSIKKRTGTRIAQEHNLDYKVMHALVKTIEESEDKNIFARQLSERINVVFSVGVSTKQVLKSM